MPTLEELLPADNILVDVMALEVSPKAQELSTRICTATTADREWLSAFLKEHARENPLPYDPRFGVTEEEYREYLALRKEGKLQKTNQIELRVKKEGSRVEIGFNEVPDATQPISIDLANQTLQTPLCSVAGPEPRDSGLTGAAIGPNQSYSWQGQTRGKDDGTWSTINFTVGKLTTGHRRFIDYQIKRFAGGRMQMLFEAIWFY